MPETVSIALTVGSLLGFTYFIETDRLQWYLLGCGALMLGVANHYWEASIALPAVVILASQDRWRHAAGVGIVTVVTLVLVRFIVGLQPDPVNLAGSFSILAVGPLWLNPDWWHQAIRPTAFQNPIGYTLPVAIVLAVGWIGAVIRRRSITTVGMVAWLISGIVIPLLLPGAYPYHRYYLWGVVAPLAVSTGVLITYGIELAIHQSSGSWTNTDTLVSVTVFKHQVRLERDAIDTDTLVSMTVAVLCLTSIWFMSLSTYGVLGDPAYGAKPQKVPESGPPAEAWATTFELQQCEDRPLVMTGEWKSDAVFWGNAGRILIYSDYFIKSHDIPVFTQDPPNSSIEVRQMNGSIEVYNCK